MAWGRPMPLALEACRKFRAEGVAIELIDLRTIYPYDWDMLKESISRTGRVLFINEDTEVCNFAEHLVRRTCDELFYELRVRPRIMAGKHSPGVGISPILEESTQPQSWHIENEIRALVSDPA